MTLVLPACLRYLLILALGLNGLALAQASVAAPVAATARSHAQHFVAMAAAPAEPCHDHIAATPDGLASPSPVPVHHGTQDGCCKGGVCACTCAAPAVLMAFFLATPVPVVHERAVTLLDYRPSHLLPLPFRPPIA